MRHSFISVAAYLSCLVALATGQAYAGNEYDKNIEHAAIDIAVEKLGSIRGSHDVDEPHALYPPIEARSAANGMLEPALHDDSPMFSPASLRSN